MVVEQLSYHTKGVLLLTATPEQLGKESHFARLRLLDPDRFPTFQQFVEEEENYEPYAQVIEDLLNNKSLTDDDVSLIKTTIDEGDNTSLLSMVSGDSADDEAVQQARIQLVEHLLDRHGTGRVLFRNTRSAVKGFPDRELSAYPLDCPEQYQVEHNSSEIQLLLTPEVLYQATDPIDHWTQFDPRVQWLKTKCAELYPSKVLVIAANASTALDITTLYYLICQLTQICWSNGLVVSIGSVS
jgi:ATP-dependent helicase HepA